MPKIEDFKREVQQAMVPNKVLADRMMALISTNTQVMIEVLKFVFSDFFNGINIF
mgnify:CR=1 FL=1